MLNKDKAFLKLEQFANSQRIGIWPYISKKSLLENIKDYIDDPTQLRSTKTYFSGQAALLYDLVRLKPDVYVDICRSIYETGAFQTRELIIEPTQALRNNKVRFSLSAANWMIFSTLHDVETQLFNGAFPLQQFAQKISSPQAMIGWTRYLLGYQLVEGINTTLYGQIEALLKAKQLINYNNIAFFLIDLQLIGINLTRNQPTFGWVHLLDIQELTLSANENELFELVFYFNGTVYRSTISAQMVEKNLAYVVLAY